MTASFNTNQIIPLYSYLPVSFRSLGDVSHRINLILCSLYVCVRASIDVSKCV